jgi:hypothetical protein
VYTQALAASFYDQLSHIFVQDKWIPNLEHMQMLREAALAARERAEMFSKENVEKLMAERGLTWDDLHVETNSLGTSRGNLTQFEEVMRQP